MSNHSLENLTNKTVEKPAIQYRLGTKNHDLIDRGKPLDLLIPLDQYEKYFSIIHEDINLSTSDEILEANDIIVRAHYLQLGQIETLKAIYEEGPLFDGNVPSKAARDYLIKIGLVTKVVVKGEEGFNACTYKGSRVLKLFKEMKT